MTCIIFYDMSMKILRSHHEEEMHLQQVHIEVCESDNESDKVWKIMSHWPVQTWVTIIIYAGSFIQCSVCLMITSGRKIKFYFLSFFRATNLSASSVSYRVT